MTEVLTVGALGSVLLRRWRLITVIAVIGAVAGGAYGYLSPKSYSAKAILLVTSGSSDQSGAYQAAQFAQNRAATYPLLVTAPEVVDATRDELKLPYSATALLAMVNVTNPTDSPLVEVTVTAGSPTEASRVADSVADNLSAYAVDLEKTGSRSSTITIQKAVPAREPTAPTSPSPVVLVALGLLAGAAIGAVIALALRVVSQSRRSDTDPYDEGHVGLREASRERLARAVSEERPQDTSAASEDSTTATGTVDDAPPATDDGDDDAPDGTGRDDRDEASDQKNGALVELKGPRPAASGGEDGRRGPRGARRPTTTVGRPTVGRLAGGSGREENTAVARPS